ncbi:MAG: hypothetical protein ABSA30_14380 [Candidatus Aminicenantales bacterium]
MFTSHVMPLIERAGCSRLECHGSSKGKGNLKLSLFSADSKADYEALAKAAKGRRIDRFEPEKSFFALKATGGVNHGGGQQIAAGSKEFDVLVAWVTQAPATRTRNCRGWFP